MITKKEFEDYKNNDFSILPMAREIVSPADNPLSLFSKIADKKNNFLFESVEGGDKWAQYSIIGFGCLDTIKAYGNVIETSIDGMNERLVSDQPLKDIEKITSKDKSPSLANLPRFYGGYVGFFAYESAQYAEKKISSLPTKDSKFSDHMPDILLVKAEQLIIFDNLTNSIKIIFNANLRNMSYSFVQSRLDEIESIILNTSVDENENFNEITNTSEFDSNFSKEEYLQAVKKVKCYIEEGDVMQVVLAQDFSTNFNKDPFELYKAIRKLNPSPYMYFLNLGDVNSWCFTNLRRLENEEVI